MNAQHNHLDWRHDTGKPNFLTDPLFAEFPKYYEAIARSVLDERGPAKGMQDAVEDLADEAGRQAPKDISNLSRSDHVTVTDQGRVVYDRAPQVPRLSPEELSQLQSGRRGRGDRTVAGAPGKEAIDNPAYDPSRGGVIGRSDPSPSVPARRRDGSARRGRGPRIS